ncbi:hypothetical protein [Paraburkholderia sp. 35.1]|uniref:hypothetical protein n=1 Tax=Paraburkholderia sp. 35.1 TaxID=2991058 RepID=UPI003D1A35EB
MQSTKIPGPVAELDFTGERPLVLIDGEALQGVTRGSVEVDAGATPVLVLRLVRFVVKGGPLPPLRLFSRKENG